MTRTNHKTMYEELRPCPQSWNTLTNDEMERIKKLNLKQDEVI